MDRTTHAHTGEIAVFLIGMTIRQPWRPDKWGPTLVAMPRMLAELERNRVRSEAGDEEWLGFLGARTLMGRGGPTVVQYWRSAEDIYRYANAADRAHRPAWAAFNRRVRNAAGSVGIWHETYAVPGGGHESLYAGVKPMGLAKYTGSVPADRRGAAARERMTASRGVVS